MAALWKRFEGSFRFMISNRACSTASIVGNSVIVKQANGQMPLETVWLRDHCRADGRYSWETHQRETILDIDHLKVPAKRVQVRGGVLGNHLKSDRADKFHSFKIGRGHALLSPSGELVVKLVRDIPSNPIPTFRFDCSKLIITFQY